MRVEELIERLGLEAFCLPDGDREVKDVYIGDMLSWVMGRAKADCAWITIMSNRNVAAVAVLADISCVLLAENVKPDEELLEIARKQSINILSAPMDSYELSWRLYGLLTNTSDGV